MNVATLEIPREILDSARLSPEELKKELAVHLYAQGRLSVGKAKDLAGMALWSFQQLLGSRQIPVHLEPADLDDDLDALSALTS
jgi:predicted HTH domain antitoxin